MGEKNGSIRTAASMLLGSMDHAQHLGVHADNVRKAFEAGRAEDAVGQVHEILQMCHEMLGNLRLADVSQSAEFTLRTETGRGGQPHDVWEDTVQAMREASGGKEFAPDDFYVASHTLYDYDKAGE